MGIGYKAARLSYYVYNVPLALTGFILLLKYLVHKLLGKIGESRD